MIILGDMMNFTRESIFVGALRSFCVSIGVILGLAIGVGIVVLGVSFIVGPQYLPPKSQPIIMPDAHGERTVLPGNAPAILRIDFHGVIGMGDLTADKIRNILLDSREDLLKGNRVKGVLLHMNTPGGASDDSDEIYRALLDYKAKYNVPIYVYVDGLCASGGMYISCAADKIYASPSSVIGSVGVIMGPTFNFSEAMSKFGVGALTITEGKDKDTLNPFRPWKPDEDASIRPIIVALYDRFVSIVASARPLLTREKLVNEYGAHVFIAKQAEELGYIDKACVDYTRTLQALTLEAKIGEKEKYQVVQLVPPHPFFTGLTQSIAPQKLLQPLALSGKLLYLYQP